MFTQVTVVGNLCGDIELKYGPNSNAYCKVSVAVNKKNKGVEKAHFFDATIFGQPAEYLATYGKKGDRILIAGELEQDRWEDKETGAKRSKVAILGFKVALLSGKPSAENTATAGDVAGEADKANATVPGTDIPF